MGLLSCLKRRKNGGIHELSARAAASCELLKLNVRHVKKLRESFNRVDLDDSGEIDYFEFTEMCGEEKTPFTNALFQLIDENGSGTLDFNEFVSVAALYCSYTQEDVLTFAFNTFDKDGSGTIDEEEFMDLARMINAGSPMFPGNFGRALSMFDNNDDGLLDFREFVEINRQFPLMLFPAFRLQDNIQAMSLGRVEWVRILRRLRWADHVANYQASHNGRKPKMGFGQFYNDKILLAGKMFVRPEVSEAALSKREKKQARRDERAVKRKAGSASPSSASKTSSSRQVKVKSKSKKADKARSPPPKNASKPKMKKRAESKRMTGVKMSPKSSKVAPSYS